MSAHVEIDFNDDGTITMTARESKDAEVRTVQLDKPWQEVIVCGGAGDEITHRIVITDESHTVINGREWAA